MNYKNQVFDITKMQHYNVGVEKKCSSLFLHLFFLKEDKGDIRGNTPADPWGRRKVYGTAEGFVFQQRIKKYDHSAFLEQLLVMLVGMADTVVVSYVGEAAVSALIILYVVCCCGCPACADWKREDSWPDVWQSGERCYGCLYHLPQNIGLFLSGSGSLQCGRGNLPQHRKDQRDDVSVRGF